MIILASQSPYKKSLMEKTGYFFETSVPRVNEEDLKRGFKGDLEDLIQFLAFKKADSLRDKYENHVIIGSDQALIFQGDLIGKGHSYEESKKQLKNFSGQKVKLVTAVTLLFEGKRIDFSNSTGLKFRELDGDLIDWYLDQDKPFDCAGSFKTESSGAVLFDYMECSDPTAVQGLPIMRLVKELESLPIKRLKRKSR